MLTHVTRGFFFKIHFDYFRMETLEDKIKSVDILANAVRMGHYDVAPNYYEYLRLAFGLANDLGEAGRGYSACAGARAPQTRQPRAQLPALHRGQAHQAVRAG